MSWVRKRLPVMHVTVELLADPQALGLVVADAVAESPEGAIVVNRLRKGPMPQADGDPGEQELGGEG